MTSADELRGRNRDLDRQLRELVATVPDERLRDAAGAGEWTLAENLAHIGEFPRYFAREITRMVAADADVEVGRTHEHPERNEAIAAAESKDRGQLSAAIDAALDEMANALGLVSDDDLRRVFTNRKYGQEPLTAYLQRYVLGHKAAHVDQLRRTLAAVAR
jgi:uncharacterized damage-inducible protein DinB